MRKFISHEIYSGEPFAKANPKNFAFFSLAKVSPRKVYRVFDFPPFVYFWFLWGFCTYFQIDSCIMLSTSGEISSSKYLLCTSSWFLFVNWRFELLKVVDWTLFLWAQFLRWSFTGSILRVLKLQPSCFFFTSSRKGSATASLHITSVLYPFQLIYYPNLLLVLLKALADLTSLVWNYCFQVNFTKIDS